MFHNILLLGPGGKTVYQGNVLDAATYFSSLGFNTPANVNPADFYMDVIGGSVKTEEDEEIDLFEAWNKRSDVEEGNSSVEKQACCGPEGRICFTILLNYHYILTISIYKCFVEVFIKFCTKLMRIRQC